MPHLNQFEIKINRKHRDLQMQGSNIGAAIGPFTLITTPGNEGGFKDFQNGSIYVSKTTGAFMVTELIRDTWRRLGAENSKLGYPITDEVDGSSRGCSKFNDFQRGTVVWKSPQNHVFAVIGDFFSKYRQLNFALGPLGYPKRNEFAVGTNERQMTFERGTIWRTDSHGTNVILNTQVCVTNDTSFSATIRFYNIRDNAVIGSSFPFPGGEIIVPANSSINWDLPARVPIVKVTFDGNFHTSSFQTVARGGHITFNQEQRISVVNNSNMQGTLRFYNPALIVRLATLANGEQPIGAHSVIMWRMPQDLISVTVTFNNIGEQTKFRGETATFNIDDKIRIHNNTANTVLFLFFNADVPDLTLTLPEGIKRVGAGMTDTFTIPANVVRVKVIKDVKPVGIFGADDRIAKNRDPRNTQIVGRGGDVSLP